MIVIAAVVALALGFFGGMQYQKSQSRTFFAQGNFGSQGGSGARGGRFGNGGGGNGANRPITGDIISADDKSITVKLQDGSSKIVLITNTTTINKASEGTKTDLTTGARVAAFGTTNTDGSMTAQNIQLNPMMRGPGNQGTSGSPAPTSQN